MSFQIMRTDMRIFILGLLAASFANPAMAIDYLVTRTDDPNPITQLPPLTLNPCQPSGGCSLRQAILAANKRPGADRIVLRAATYTLSRTTMSTEVDGTAGPLWVTDETEIMGVNRPDTRIQWNSSLHHSHSVLVYGDKLVSTPRLKIRDLTIANGRGESGGCMLSRGAELALDNVLIENCRARNGGAIYSIGPMVVLTNSLFRYNEVTNNGGAIYFSRSATVVASLASFLANSALNDGGAIYAEGNYGSFGTSPADVVWRAEGYLNTFADNTAGRDGGAIALGALSSLNLFRYPITTPRTRFERNIAGGKGGAVSVVSLSPSVLTKLTIEGVLLKDNAAAIGGAIAARGQSLIVDSEFESNRAQAGSGGAIFLDSASNAILGNHEIRGTSFNTNAASSNGDAIASVCQPLTVRDTSLWANDTNAIHSSGTTWLVHISTRNHGANALVKGYHTACPNQPFGMANSIVGMLDRCVTVSGAISSYGGNFYSANAAGCGFVAGSDFQYGSAVIAIEPGTYSGEKTVLGWNTDALVRPQVNAGVQAYCSTVDVRGLARTGACDSGAFEQQ
jgi:predicted outer membrane repeat protein